MLTNYHTHSTFSDGKNTPEEIVCYAIEIGMTSIGFSDHCHTPFDMRYCMSDTDGYIREINRLKKAYGDKIQIYLGIEEDAHSCTNPQNFDYIIGSSHYFHIGDQYYPIDSNYGYFQKCLEVFRYDACHLARTYYENFCDYIKRRKPDIIGHFDLITKFDETSGSYFLENAEYQKIAEQYAREMAKTGCLFEVNTGAISRGFRSTPYPASHVLRVLQKENCGLILSSDSHSAETLTFYFEETKYLLKDIGFQHIYVIKDNSFQKVTLS